jgi:hypothetical protein
LHRQFVDCGYQPEATLKRALGIVFVGAVVLTLAFRVGRRTAEVPAEPEPTTVEV